MFSPISKCIILESRSYANYTDEIIGSAHGQDSNYRLPVQTFQDSGRFSMLVSIHSLRLAKAGKFRASERSNQTATRRDISTRLGRPETIVSLHLWIRDDIF
jgi:hypothetical protein